MVLRDGQRLRDPKTVSGKEGEFIGGYNKHGGYGWLDSIRPLQDYGSYAFKWRVSGLNS